MRSKTAPNPHSLIRAFLKVGHFASRKVPRLAQTRLAECPAIDAERKAKGVTGRRSFMHVGHHPSTICTSRAAGRLPWPHLIGIFLHEFGHIGSGAGEKKADEWVFVVLGIPIEYRGKLMLEWVQPAMLETKGIC